MAVSVSTKGYSGKSSGATSGKSIYRIVGIACILGFILDLVVLAAPPSPMALEWRLGFLRQVGERSIVFTLGIAFLMMGALEARSLLKKAALVSMVVGLIFCLLVPLSIRDSIALQKQANNRITSQASQIESQIQKIQSDPKLKQKLTDVQLQQAMSRLSTQSEALQKNATKGAIKTGAASVTNLLVSGLALLGLGRYGMRRG